MPSLVVSRRPIRAARSEWADVSQYGFNGSLSISSFQAGLIYASLSFVKLAGKPVRSLQGPARSIRALERAPV
jgi:hypothetical protein